MDTNEVRNEIDAALRPIHAEIADLRHRLDQAEATIEQLRRHKADDPSSY